MIKFIVKGLLAFMVFAFLAIPVISTAQIRIGSDLSEIDYERPTEYVIGGVEVVGIEFLDKNVIIMLSELDIGAKIKIPGDAITTAIRKLWDQGLFDNISVVAERIEGNTIFLKLILRERPRLSKFSFKGIRKSEADDIREKINLSRGDVVTDHLMIKSIRIIKGYYADKGFLNAEVAIEEKLDNTHESFEELVIDVKKNSKVKIKNITIVGNSEMNDDAIRASMKETKERGVFTPLDSLGPLVINLTRDAATLHFDRFRDNLVRYYKENYKVKIFKGSKFLEKNYEDDKSLIIAKYNKKGYRDAQITSDSIYKIDKQNIGIVLNIDEGNKYYFRKITWVGNTVYSSMFLSNILGIHSGDVYNKELLETNLQFNPSGFDVSSLYMDNGYLFFNATPIEVTVENDSIDLEIRVYEGKQARINSVTIKGNEKTNDHVIIRELRTRPGQLFSRSDVIRTTRELANLRYFNPETIQPNIMPNPAEGTVDIEYQVEETSADQIELSGGWGYGRIIGTLGLSFNNFSLRNMFTKGAWRPVPSGDGQKLSLKFSTYGKDYMQWSVSFTEPWLGGKKPNAFTVSYFHSIFSNGQPSYSDARQSFKMDGITFGLGKRLTWPDDYFTLYQAINFQLYKLDNYSSIFPIGSGTGNYNNISYEIVLGRSSVDAPIYPRRGSEISLGLELTPPYSLFMDYDYDNISDDEKYKWIEYHKWKFKAYWYFEVLDKLVLAPRFRFGFLGHYNNQLGTTLFERFYLGGDGLGGQQNYDGREQVSLRGYENESITPLHYLGRSIGGTIFTRYTLELRYPVSLNPSSTIYVLGFVEAGNSWLGAQGFDPFDVYRAAGFGVRVFLPMFGMLGLDWAYGFDPVPGIPSAAGSHFHFSMNGSID